MEAKYESMNDWYHPEIDYKDMMEKLRWTKDPFYEKLGGVERFPYYKIPLSRVDMFHHLQSHGRSGFTPPFQWWNKQFNDALSRVLMSCGGSNSLILEVGAGNGMLSAVLLSRDFYVVAIDNYSWEYIKRYTKVEKMDYREALALYKPKVVISSWMPFEEDWTPDFRACDSVEAYIQIGEVGAACGGDWGSRSGWNVKEMSECSKYSICRTDSFGACAMKMSYVYMSTRLGGD